MQISELWEHHVGENLLGWEDGYPPHANSCQWLACHSQSPRGELRSYRHLFSH
jgi:hypothetical protein